MKILTLLLTAGLFLSTFTSYQEQESPELKEAIALTDSVVKLFKEGKYDEALPLAKRALQIREKLLPRTDPRVVTSLAYVGDLYLTKRDYNAAKETFERLLSILEEKFGPTDSNLITAIDRLAVIYHRQGSMSKAEDMYQRALAVREKAFGPDSVETAEPLFALGQFYRFRRDFDRAALTYKRVLSILGRASKAGTPEFTRAANGFECLGYESENQAVFKELKEIRKQFAPDDQALEPLAIINGMAISLARPEYPPEARQLRLSGTIVVLAEIDETGKVISASDMCQGLPYLSESAVKAALKSRFTPTKLSGVPVKTKGVIKYNFVNLGTTYK